MAQMISSCTNRDNRHAFTNMHPARPTAGSEVRIMLDAILGFGIGYAAGAALKRVRRLWLRWPAYISAWLALYVILAVIGELLAREAGLPTGGSVSMTLANTMTVGLIIGTWSVAPATSTVDGCDRTEAVSNKSNESKSPI